MICNTYIQFFSSLSDRTRLEIIKSLKEQPKSVNELADVLSFEQSRVSHNLKKLKHLGFVIVQQQGKQRIYSLDKKIIIPLLKLIDQHVNTYYKHYCQCTGEEKRKRWKQISHTTIRRKHHGI